MLHLTELAVLGFAAARISQLLVDDTILDPARARLEMWHAGNHEGYWRNFWRDLFSCHFCVGFHASWALLLTYLLATGGWGDAPVLVHGVEVFAVAGMQMAVNMAVDKAARQ